MMPPGSAVFAAALGLVGCRFRLHGRDPSTGLDCVGLVGHALRLAGCDARLPHSYRLKHQSFDQFLPFAEASGLTPAIGGDLRGDIFMFKVGPAQCHLAVSDGSGSIVHAHAGLGRVVHSAPSSSWSAIRHWRISAIPCPQHLKEF